MMNNGPLETQCEGYARMMSHRGGYTERKSSGVNLRRENTQTDTAIQYKSANSIYATIIIANLSDLGGSD